MTMKRSLLFLASLFALLGAPALAQEGNSYNPNSGTLTGNSTPTSGFSAGQLFYSDGAKLQALGQGSSGQFLESQGAGATPTWGSASGSGTVNSGSQYCVAYYAASGTTISCIPYLTINGATLEVGANGSPGALLIWGNVAGQSSSIVASTNSGSSSFTLPPAAVDVLLGAAATQTLTNKTINCASNACSNISLASQVTGNLPVGNLNSGSGASSSTFWRGDGTWATAGGGSISANSSLTSGYSANQFVYSDGTKVQAGTFGSGLSFSGGTLSVSGTTPTNVITYTSAGSTTYTPSTGAKFINIFVQGAGGGGGSGAVQTSGAACSGGAGGGGGAYMTASLAVSALPTGTLTMVVGAGGTAGGAVSSASATSGSAGSPGGDTYLWNGTTYVVRGRGGGGGAGGGLAVASGGGGGAGTVTAGGSGSGASAGSAGAFFGIAGVSGSGGTNQNNLIGGGSGAGSAASGSAGNIGGSTPYPGAGGGSGGGITTGNVTSSGGASGVVYYTTQLAQASGGSAGSSSNGGAGGSGSNFTAGPIVIGGAAGGGGGSAISTYTGGAGGVGGTGAGGGGGGCAQTNSTSGAGGTGGVGLAAIVEYF